MIQQECLVQIHVELVDTVHLEVLSKLTVHWVLITQIQEVLRQVLVHHVMQVTTVIRNQ